MFLSCVFSGQRVLLLSFNDTPSPSNVTVGHTFIYICMKCGCPHTTPPQLPSHTIPRTVHYPCLCPDFLPELVYLLLSRYSGWGHIHWSECLLDRPSFTSQHFKTGLWGGSVVEISYKVNNAVAWCCQQSRDAKRKKYNYLTSCSRVLGWVNGGSNYDSLNRTE